ncbi:MAG: nuclear transport factor 2 family protein [Acidocella sp.]|nr:nuclear transport factor 2 family protein [Acidocella sp.]
MEKTIETMVRQLADRQDIQDCLLRYTRGVDRLDRALMLSAYHLDAIDDHGSVVLGAEKFVDWALDFHTLNQRKHHHAITNLTIELAGDVAHTECYYTYFGDNREGRSTLAFGRYVDRLEKRDGVWGIVARQCLTDAVHDLESTAIPDEYRAALMANGPNSRNRDDVSYDRPLRVTRAPTG